MYRVHSRFAAGLLRRCALAALCTGMPVVASTITPYDQGFLSEEVFTGPPAVASATLIHDPGDTSVFLKHWVFPWDIGVYRHLIKDGYALFSIPSALVEPTTAEIRFTLTGLGVTDPIHGPPPYQFHWSAWDIDSAPGAFDQSYSGPRTDAGFAFASDISGGVPYAQAWAYEDGVFSFELGRAAMANLVASRGGMFGIGFSGYGTASHFGWNEVQLSNIELVIDAVPEPGTAALLLSGLMLGAVMRLRRVGPLSVASAHPR